MYTVECSNVLGEFVSLVTQKGDQKRTKEGENSLIYSPEHLYACCSDDLVVLEKSR